MLSTATYIWIIASSHGSHDTHWLGRLDVCLVVHVGPSATVHTAASAWSPATLGPFSKQAENASAGVK